MTRRSAPWRISRPLPIIPGESLDGYVSRVAADHHMPRLADITQIAGATASIRQHATFCDPNQLDVLTDCLGVDPEVLRLHAPQCTENPLAYNFFGTEVLRHQLQFAHRRFSPAGLMRSPHHRALWTLRFFPFCSETWEYLVDRCPNPSCRRRQFWRRTVGIELCDFCAEPLTRADAVPVPEELRPNLRMLLGLVHPDAAWREQTREQLPPKLVDIGGGDLLELACALSAVVDHRTCRPVRLRTLSLPLAETVIVPALARTWPLLSDWPRSLENLMSDRINRNAKGRGDGNYGASCNFLSSVRYRELPPAVSSVITEFVGQCREARARGLTVAEARKKSGGRSSALVAMRRAGDIPSVLTLFGQRLHVLFDKDAIERLAEVKRPRQRLHGAASQLGVPSYAIHELVHCGALESATLPPGCSDQLAVDQASLSQFIEELLGRFHEFEKGYKFSLAELMMRIGGRPKPWANVLIAIQSGLLPATLKAGNAPLAKRIMLKDDGVLAKCMFTDCVDKDWHNVSITKADAADILNLSVTNFGRYSEFLFGPGRDYQEILMDDVLRRAAQYVSTTELAHRLRIHHVAVRNLAFYRGVKIRSKGLFDRASVKALIPELAESDFGDVAAGLTSPASGQNNVGMVMCATILRNGRIILPRYIRNRLGLTDGGKVYFEETGDGIVFRGSAHIESSTQYLEKEVKPDITVVINTVSSKASPREHQG